MPQVEGEPPNHGFACPIDPPRTDPSGQPTPPPALITGPDDARFVRGELSDDRAEVQYLSPWGLVSIPTVNFAWIVELPTSAKGRQVKP